jgi:gamma-glutamyltranspeptidase / glutathione hydrolase
LSLTRKLAFAARLVVLFVLMAWAFSAIGDGVAATGPPAAARRGMVVTSQTGASEIGLAILRQGGTAVDAAVAAAFAMAVLEPQHASIGGGGAALVYTKSGNRIQSLDFRERAPATATPALYMVGGKHDRRTAEVGQLSVAVPGAVAGLCELHKKYGSLPLARVIEPSVKLARTGFLAGSDFVMAVGEKLSLLQADRDASKIFMPGNRPPQPAERIRQHNLAETFQKIGRSGASGFYQGAVAGAIAAYCKKTGCLLTAKDLAAYVPVWSDPVSGKYRKGYEIYSAPPPAAGVSLIEMLAILNGFDIADSGFNSAATIHLNAETAKLVFADYAAYLADPQLAKVDSVTMTSSAYATERRRKIDREAAAVAEEVTPGALSVGGEAGTAGEALPDWQTTVILAADGNGNLVSLTLSVGDTFGSGIVAGKTGVLLNNAMASFSTAGPNALAAGKRPAGYAVPTIVMSKGRPMFIIGGAGGRRAITATANAISGIIDFGMDVAQGIDASRTHQGPSGGLVLERFATPAEVVNLLEALGHEISVSSYIGNSNAIMIDLWSNTLTGAADARNAEGQVSGY